MLLALALILVYSAACSSPTEPKKGVWEFFVECFVIQIDSVSWTDSCVVTDSVWVPKP